MSKLTNVQNYLSLKFQKFVVDRIDRGYCVMSDERAHERDPVTCCL